MAFVEVEIEDTSDSELSRIDHEDTEEQTGWCPFLKATKQMLCQ